MVRMSVPEVAARLGVSPVRVRQRIAAGSLVAEKVGGRWLVDLDPAGVAGRPVRGRPVAAGSVWYSLLALDADSLIGVPMSDAPKVDRSGIDLPRVEVAWPGMAAEVRKLSAASRHRAVSRLSAAIGRADHDSVLAWLRHRGDRRRFNAADPDLERLRDDDRFRVSGVSHPGSEMSDPRVAEGYVAGADFDALVHDYWLDQLSPGDRPNVVIHVVPALPPRISRLLLVADLAEHGGPRELRRAHELLDQWIHDVQEEP